MANTYTQIYLHAVFAVSGRACVIAEARREELQKYITGIVTRRGQKLIAIYCMPDQTHMLVGLTPNIAPSELIGDIKTDQLITSTSGDGSGVIFPGRKATGRFPCPIRIWIRVVKYIRNQPTHHRRKSFQQEYVEFLERHHVPYDQRYIFKPIRVDPEC